MRLLQEVGVRVLDGEARSLLAEAELEKDALREVAKGKF